MKKMTVQKVNRSSFLKEGENGNFMSCSVTMIVPGTNVILNASFTDDRTELYSDSGRKTEGGETVFELNSGEPLFSKGDILNVEVQDISEGWFKISQKVDNTSEDVLDFFSEEVETSEKKVKVKS